MTTANQPENCFHTEGAHEKLAKWLQSIEVQITLNDSGKPTPPPLISKSLQCFDNIIRNVTILSWNFKKNKNLKLLNLTNYMMEKCDKNLLKICIIGDINLILLGQQIKSLLWNVQTVEFRNRRIGGADEIQFLNCSPNLNKLILCNEINRQNVNAILRQRYRRLRHFHYLHDNGNNLNPKKLKVFFRNNDNIQYIVWKFCNFDNLSRHNFVRCIRSVLYAKHLKHFHLCFSNQLTIYTQEHFDNICNQLNLLCQRDTFTFLEISLNAYDDDTSTVLSRLKCFAKWKQLSKIHLQRFGIITTMLVISEFVHLKSIVFNDCFIDESVYSIDVVEVSQISKLVMKNEIFNDLTELCMPFVRHWKNLRTIFVPVANYGSKLDIAKLNRAREKLNDACELTILTKHKSLPTDLEHPLVKLQCNLNR